ncbi:MAG: hypothetical protein FE78DRAFT_31959 [Acidomyces sp. 'richmondensis']|nr:MAG: hypothetical protein FE78DRAFT_31959 [Acidomyces sp. 'richmondensis']
MSGRRKRHESPLWLSALSWIGSYLAADESSAHVAYSPYGTLRKAGHEFPSFSNRRLAKTQDVRWCRMQFECGVIPALREDVPERRPGRRHGGIKMTIITIAREKVGHRLMLPNSSGKTANQGAQCEVIPFFGFFLTYFASCATEKTV